MGATLAPIPYKLIEDEPVVVETEGESAWAAWDESVRKLDRLTPEGRAQALAESVAA